MLSSKRARKIFTGFAITTAILGGAYFYAVTPHEPSAPPDSAEGLLERADALAWGNRWADATPLFIRAEQLFAYQRNPAKALYAKVSQIPANESGSVPGKILALTKDLDQPGGADPETRIRILTIRGMLETNYDAGQARSTWKEIESQALKLRHLELATRAQGEQGIAAFILGDTETAKKLVIRAWTLSKVERDPAATVRYASVFGAGLVQFHRYQEALTPLDQAIKIATANPRIAYPSIAVYAKIDALTGLKQYDAALALANSSLARLQGTLYEQHKGEIYESLGRINRDKGALEPAISNYKQAFAIFQSTDNSRGLTDVGGLLAQAYEQTGDLNNALNTINAAIQANTNIPDELYLVPRNLAIKAEITEKLGNTAAADVLYKKSIALVDAMIHHASTTNIERYLLAEMSDVYSGYFAELCARHQYDAALETLEKVRGRIETEALENHHSVKVHDPSQEEQELTRLNIELINSDDPKKREELTNSIYDKELELSPSALAEEAIEHPVHLRELQSRLPLNTLLIEYVLAEPNSYAFAVTHESVMPYRLPSKQIIETNTGRYRKEIRAEKEDASLAQELFGELLAPIKEYTHKTDLVLVPDGALHLLPFSALNDGSGYVLKTHTIDVSPSSTVYNLLSRRVENREPVSMPYIGVAAWTQTHDDRNWVLRSVTGPKRSELVPLPGSEKEVETIAAELPRPSTILLGPEATESRFKQLSSESNEVIHLALHGYADLDYPDRSALVFAPENGSSTEDGLLQVREIRMLHLKSRLVTLSACDTGVGPVGVAGVSNIVNAFVEAGADTVVSTLWELEDHTTERLMAQFYAGLAQHKRKVDALRGAQLDLLQQGVAPYFWASFQVVGDPNGTL